MQPPLLKNTIRAAVFPFLRGYLRYFPLTWGKAAIFRKVVEPYFFLRPRLYTAHILNGMKMTGNNRDFIQSWVYFFGITEPNLARWLERALRPGDTFIDVGAHVGYHTLLASQLVGNTGRVVAIEASPSTFFALQKNLALNQIQNVRAINIAASDHKGSVNIYRGPDHDLGSSTIYAEVQKKGSSLEAEVPMAPLVEILTPDELKQARIIKIDVEGAEEAVLRGLAPAINQCRKDLEVVLEVIPEYLSELNKKAEDVFRTLTESGFNSYGLEGEYRPEPFLSGERPAIPKRIREPILHDTNVILSRSDVEAL